MKSKDNLINTSQKIKKQKMKKMMLKLGCYKNCKLKKNKKK